MQCVRVVAARWVALAVATVAAVVCVVAVPAAALPSAVTAAGGSAWGAAATIIPNAGVSAIPRLVLDASGDGYVASSGPGAALQGVAVASDSTTGTPQVLAPAIEHPRDTGLGISSSGTVTVSYTVGLGRDARVLVRQDVLSARARQISPPRATASLVSFQEAPDGFAGALLCLGSHGHRRYALFGRPRDGVSFRRVASLPAGARAPALAVASDGALVAWVSGETSGQPIRALEVRRNGNASPAVTVAQHPHISPFFPLQPALVPGGGALVAWDVSQPGDRRSVTVATHASDAARFGPTRALTTGADHRDTLELRVTPNRDSVLISTSERQPQGTYRVVVRTWSRASGFGQPRFASPASRDAFDPFAGAGGGRTIVAWDGLEGIEAAMAPSASAFATPDALSAAAAQSGPQVAVDARGAALAAWARYGAIGRRAGQVELARLAPPASPRSSRSVTDSSTSSVR